MVAEGASAEAEAAAAAAGAEEESTLEEAVRSGVAVPGRPHIFLDDEVDPGREAENVTDMAQARRSTETQVLFQQSGIRQDGPAAGAWRPSAGRTALPCVEQTARARGRVAAAVLPKRRRAQACRRGELKDRRDRIFREHFGERSLRSGQTPGCAFFKRHSVAAVSRKHFTEN